MKLHPLCEAFPRLSENELNELASDIKQNGQRQDILTLDGMVLDGQNRLLACEIAKVEPRFKKFKGDPVALVKSLNINRRHLNESQRAMVAAELINWSKGSNDPVSVEKAAEQLNTSTPSVKRAMKVVKSGSKALKQSVVKGKTAVSKAAKIARLPKNKQSKAMKAKAKPARGGLAAAALADQSKKLAKHLAGSGPLDAMDSWWKDNSVRLSEYPAASPAVVFKELRRVVAENL